MFKLGMVDIDGVRLESNFVPNKTDAVSDHLRRARVALISFVSQKTGKETLAERWILHKLSKASAEINKDLERRAFHDATEKMHAFWLYDLCDVFIEATKPFTTEETPAEIKESVKNTIYTCLESALRLVHPVMPYVSEDLWQRLPRRAEDKSETIMLCPYPTEASVAVHWS